MFFEVPKLDNYTDLLAIDGVQSRKQKTPIIIKITSISKQINVSNNVIWGFLRVNTLCGVHNW